MSDKNTNTNKPLGTITVELSADATNILTKLIAVLSKDAPQVAAETPKAEKVSKPKKEKVETKAAEEVTELGDDLPNAEDDLFGDDEEAGAKEVAYTSQDILAGFKAFAKRHDRDAARKVLAKFGYKSVQDVEPKNYTKVMLMIA